MILNDINSLKDFNKYFELFNETTNISPILSQNAKDALSEKFLEVSNILTSEITRIATYNIEVVEPIIIKDELKIDLFLDMISSMTKNRKPIFFWGNAETGKSLYAYQIANICFKDKTLYLRGSNYEIMQNKFAFMEVKESTELIIIDDIENEDVIFYAIQLFNSFFPINKRGSMPYQQVIPNMILICGFSLSEVSLNRILKKCSVFKFDKNRVVELIEVKG